jgi:hypothetical protein
LQRISAACVAVAGFASAGLAPNPPPWGINDAETPSFAPLAIGLATTTTTIPMADWDAFTDNAAVKLLDRKFST